VKRPWLLAIASLALTCNRSGSVASAHSEAPQPPVNPPSVSVVRPTAVPSVAAPIQPYVPSSAAPLSRFFGELRALRSGTRPSHVRVVWLGDSHTAADYLSGAVRAELSARFGDGGPGFVRIGTRPYRHDGLRVLRDGKWNVDPDSPARRTLQGDGIFGFAGTRAVPEAGASFSVEQNLPALPTATARAEEPGTFELQYALPEGASFDVQLGARRTTVTKATQSDQTPHGIAHLTLSAPLSSRLLLLPRAGTPRLFGVVIERQSAVGVVLDTAGIDGARLETPLAWNEQAFVGELSRRAPELFVLAYGTNESFDALRVSKYGDQLAELVRRVRLAAPSASCLVLGPTDAPLGAGSLPRVAEVTRELRQAAARLGCAFASLQQLMGGEGSFVAGLSAKDRLSQPDRLHLTPKGYQELGRALSQLLLDAYSAGRSNLP